MCQYEGKGIISICEDCKRLLIITDEYVQKLNDKADKGNGITDVDVNLVCMSTLDLLFCVAEFMNKKESWGQTLCVAVGAHLPTIQNAQTIEPTTAWSAVSSPLVQAPSTHFLQLSGLGHTLWANSDEDLA